ncbi:MAG: hypothetical protein J6U65_08740, partial [Bacteroidaceae bacterium]|nr:hypothetical protein [Bacteroidaceae bacterium]
MKKISTLLMLFCAFVCSAWAAPTDLPEMSTEGNIKYYTISNTRSTSGKYLYWSESGVKDANARKLSSLFYFTGTPEECYIHNAATDLLFTGAGAWNSTGVKCEICVTPHGDGTTGLAIKFSGTALNESNTGNGYTTWGAGDAGSVFVMDVANVAQMAADYKTAANSALDMISFLGVDEAKNTIANLEENINTFAAVDAAVNSVVAEKYVAFRNGETNVNSCRYNNYLLADMERSKGCGTNTFNHLIGTWRLIYSGEGSFYIYNVNKEVYLGNPGSNGALSKTPNATYTFEKIEENKVELKSGDQTLHLNNHDQSDVVAIGTFLSSFDNNDVASRWYVETDFAAHVATYKNTALTALDSWKTLSVVFDGAPIDETKAAIETIATTNYATFAAIDAELKKVFDAVAAKMLTFQCTDTSDKARDLVYVAANASTGKAVGADNQDYNAIWTLHHAGGVSFYIYNELTAKYMGKPSGNATLTDAPVDAYTFEIIDAANGVVEFKCGGETLHASNHNDDNLMNYDGDQAASRWYVATIDITAELQELIEANASNYAEVPALGQYSKAGYDALVAAKNNAKTVEEVLAALAAFQASLNAPVYIFSGVHDYANGKAIYYNGSNPEWRWDTKNAYNKAMWFRVLGLTTPEFELNTEYNVVDMSGRNIYNKASIKFETVENWDGVYCLKFGNGDTDYLHLANHTNNTIANWYPATIKEDGTPDCGASAWKVEYIGNSYDLAQLSDEFFTTAAELAAVNVPNFNFAAGMNNYNAATKPALDEAVANRTTVLSKFSTAEELAAAKAQLETAIAGVQLNMPVNGKFYRVRCADHGTGMRRLQSTINNNRLQMISAEAGINVNSIFCYVDGGLLSYTTGKYINAYNFDAVGTKSTVTFSNAYNGTLGQYNIKINDSRYIYGKKNEIDSGEGNPTDGGYNWWLEEVNEIPVTITPAGYATFYAPVALTLPSEVKAYTVTVNGESAMLNEIKDGVIPANTGVVLEGAPETYNLTVAESDLTISGNELLGTVAASYVTDAAYVLGYINIAEEGQPEDMQVGFYTATKNQQEGA